MSEPSLAESFVEVACCDIETACRYLQHNAGDMMKALAKYFHDEERRWEATAAHRPTQQPATQPVSAKEGEDTEEETSEKDEGKRPVGEKQKRPTEEEAEHDHLDPSLPWNKVRFDPAADVAGKKEAEAGGEVAGKVGPMQNFAYDAVKSKVQMTNFQGPQDGSTWHWFLVADQKVYPENKDDAEHGADGGRGSGDANKGVKRASTIIHGDKFQAGWARDPSEKMPEKEMNTRKASMLECVLQNKVNSYGKKRRGCKPGYSHRWTYSDSLWCDPAATTKGTKTTECFWDEQRNEDRWLVTVQMKWDATAEPIVPGVYVIVADQMASKLNKNQYQTNMVGRRWRIGALNDDPAELAAAKRMVLANCLQALRDQGAAACKPNTTSSPAKKQKKEADPSPKKVTKKVH